MTAAVAAIDGGNSKTDVLLIAENGEVLGRARGGGSCYQTVGLDRTIEVVGELLAEAAGGVQPPYAKHVYACMAGADLPREEQLLTEVLGGWSDRITVTNDTFALLRAGTQDGVGVAVVCGAGVNAVGVAPDGRTHRFPAIGQLAGDWGGGGFLGREIFWWAIRAEDGRGPATSLRDAVIEHFGVRTVTEAMEQLHFGERPTSALHGLVPLLYREAGAGDPVSVRLTDQQADEITVMATVTLRELNLLAEPVKVLLGGGVVTGMPGPFLADVERRIHGMAPKVTIELVAAPPVIGAALLGLDALGLTTPEVETRLRS
ncbi:ATPase [Pseudonocardiaceae bacterium YIM PH 21723]|nr:ATPase [Pseudonocardiaceae bacterium YIM PH 21723]